MNLGHWASQPSGQPSHVCVLHHERGLDDVARSDPSGRDTKWRFDQDLLSLSILQMNPLNPSLLTSLTKIQAWQKKFQFRLRDLSFFRKFLPTHLFHFCENSFKEPRHIRAENKFSQPRK